MRGYLTDPGSAVKFCSANVKTKNERLLLLNAELIAFKLKFIYLGNKGCMRHGAQKFKQCILSSSSLIE